jgi:hypothetical protein
MLVKEPDGLARPRTGHVSSPENLPDRASLLRLIELGKASRTRRIRHKCCGSSSRGDRALRDRSRLRRARSGREPRVRHRREPGLVLRWSSRRSRSARRSSEGGRGCEADLPQALRRWARARSGAQPRRDRRALCCMRSAGSIGERSGSALPRRPRSGARVHGGERALDRAVRVAGGLALENARGPSCEERGVGRGRGDDPPPARRRPSGASATTSWSEPRTRCRSSTGSST